MRTALLSASSILVLSLAGSASAQDSTRRNDVEPADLGVVEAPTAGSVQVALTQVPADVLHTAKVAFKVFDSRATLIGAQLDQDDVVAVWEIKGRTHDGRLLEADIRGGKVEELEIEVRRNDVPAEVNSALRQFAPQYQQANELPVIEKSVRPSANGLLEIWYEFSGTTFDVEVRSDGRAVLIEPA